MSDVGEVRYKARVDTSAVDEDAKKAEEAVKKSSKGVEKASEDTGEKVRDQSKKTKDQTEKDSEESSNKFAANWSSAGAKAAKAIGAAAVAIGAAAVGGIAALGKMGVEYNAQMEMYTANFAVLLGGQEKAVKKMEQLKEYAAKTPFELSDLADATKTLLAFNVAEEDSAQVLSMLGDISLGSAEKLETLTRAFGKMHSSQKVSREDIDMMIDAGFNPLLLVSEKTGESIQDLYDRISEGEMAVSEITEAMQQATSKGGQFYKGTETGAQTLSGKFSTLKDNFAAFTGEITEGVTPALMEAMDAVTGLFEDDALKGALTDIFDGISQIAVDALPVLVGTIAEMAPVAGEIVESLLPILLELLQNLVPPLMELVQALLPVLSEVLLTLLPPLMEIVDALMPVLLEVIEALLPILSLLLEALTPILDLFLEMLQPILNLVSNGIVPLVEVLKYLIEAALVPLQLMLAQTMGVFTAVFNAITSMVVNAVDTWRSVLDGVLGFIKGVFTGDWQRAWEGIKQIFGSIFSGLVNMAKIPINGIIDIINGFLGGLNGIRIPDWVPGVGGASFSIPLIPRLKKGMPFVPSDFFPAYLDYGERVLTKEQNTMLNSIGGFPAVQQAAQEVASGATRGGGINNSTHIEVPVSIDGREVARATAWYMGEQLAWEERR